jgi:hypothetical protein
MIFINCTPIKCRRMIWAKCVSRMGEKNLKGRVHLDDLDVDGKVVLEQILGK